MPVTHDSNCDSIQSPSDIVAGISKPCNCDFERRLEAQEPDPGETPDEMIARLTAPVCVIRADPGVCDVVRGVLVWETGKTETYDPSELAAMEAFVECMDECRVENAQP